VSKTDVTSYLRCPYAFWLTDSGQLDRAELLSPFEAQLAKTGIAFEQGIVEAATPIELPPGGEAELFTGDHTILQVRAFRNHELKLIGRPDGLVTARGALQPVEIKAHRLLRHSDRIELAFYWLLLSPMRTAIAADPVGWVLLRKLDGSHTQEKVELAPELIAETKKLITAVRRARLEGIQPTWCRCTICRGVRYHEVVASIQERRDVSSIWGVGRIKREALQAAGYTRWEDLLNHDAETTATAINLPRARRLVNASEVQRWQAHAQALITNDAIRGVDAEPFPVPGEYIAFDAEYTAANIWLLGARVVRHDGDLSFSVWASPQGEAQALSDFDTFLNEHPDSPVVTWNGCGADLPALRKAAARAGCPALAERIHDRHIDLFAWTRRNLMLPIPGFGLKEVSEHFHVSRQSGVSSGLEAEMLWQRYQLTGNQELKAELISYNMDDLGSLVRAVECLRACAAGRPFETAGPPNTVLEASVLEREPDGPPLFRPDAMLAQLGRRIRRPVPKPREAIALSTGNRARWRQRVLGWARDRAGQGRGPDGRAQDGHAPGADQGGVGDASRERPHRPATRRATGRRTTSAEIRAWAAEHGYTLDLRERIPGSVIKAWQAAHEHPDHPSG
jgi:predicted RecB family nuclease